MPQQASECATRPRALGSLPPVEILFGRTEAMHHIRLQIARAIDARLPVLIRGETGTGKEVTAAFIHSQAPWRNGPFVKAYCPAIAATPLERSLLSAEPDYLSNCYQTKRCPTKGEPKGTIFLDEIAELDSRLQAKLLDRMRCGHTFHMATSEDTARAAHVICSTRQHIEDEIENGRFRRDLFHRINVMTLRLPPLRERREDVPILVEHFLRIYTKRFNRRMFPASEKWIRQLQECNWPGNIRELENTVCSYLLLGPEAAPPPSTVHRGVLGLSSTIARRQFPKTKRQPRTHAVLEDERGALLRVLATNQGNRKKAARALHVSHRASLHKLKDMGIAPKRIQSAQRNPTLTKAGP